LFLVERGSVGKGRACGMVPIGLHASYD
jgi:hypothetical protein